MKRPYSRPTIECYTYATERGFAASVGFDIDQNSEEEKLFNYRTSEEVTEYTNDGEFDAVYWE
ncbi:MAG: hypothetical protein IJ789_04335 [Bacteroidales bacterium]|nr:hypothetical protein [Bacteroidales bacterium]